MPNRKSIADILDSSSQSDRRQEPSDRDHNELRGTRVHILLEWCNANGIHIDSRLQITAARGERDGDEASTDDDSNEVGSERGIAVYATNAVLENGTTRTRSSYVYRVALPNIVCD